MVLSDVCFQAWYGVFATFWAEYSCLAARGIRSGLISREPRRRQNASQTNLSLLSSPTHRHRSDPRPQRGLGGVAADRSLSFHTGAHGLFDAGPHNIFGDFDDSQAQDGHASDIINDDQDEDDGRDEQDDEEGGDEDDGGEVSGTNDDTKKKSGSRGITWTGK